MEDGKRRVAKNSIYSIAASAIPLSVLQLLILPLLNSRIGEAEYGLVVTLVSLFTLFPVVFGNTLNNVRIIRDQKYKEEGVEGDFNFLALLLMVSAVFMTAIVGLIYIGECSLFDCIGLSAVAALYFFDAYYSVGFLLRLDYRRVLICSILKSAGFLIGLALFFVVDTWYVIYAVGYLLGDAYIARTTSLLNESRQITRLFRGTAKDEALLLLSVFLNNVTTYADRLVLFPLLGGYAVAVYYAATLLGKLISLAVSPISSVLLSYLGRMRRLSSGGIRMIVLTSGLIGLVMYVGCLVVSEPVLRLLYPTMADEAASLVALTYAASVLHALISFINPVVLRFCSMRWQSIISGITILSYFVFSLLFLSIWGLAGFALGVLLSSALSLAARLVLIAVKREDISRETV